MDPLITAAARSLASGDPLGALKRIALRDDAPALALRGIAMAQLGDFARSKELLRRAERAFGTKDVVARARCVVAEAEVAFAQRELSWSPKALDAARETLESHGDRMNAVHARHLQIRRLLLIGHIDEAERQLAALDVIPLSPALRTAHALAVAGIAMRRVRAREAQTALARAERAARAAGIPALTAEVEAAWRNLREPAARLVMSGEERPLLLEEVEAVLSSDALVVDACRLVVRQGKGIVSLAKRPVLFALARALGQAWPNDVSRDELIARAFASRFSDESHRARLRVELARLRSALRAFADVRATKRGFALEPKGQRNVVVLTFPIENEHATVLALLADGESWSSSALAIALGTSQRTVQRALDSLVTTGNVQALGRGRARRWITTPLPGFTTSLLLPSPLAIE
jgi:hypothetical protein